MVKITETTTCVDVRFMGFSTVQNDVSIFVNALLVAMKLLCVGKSADANTQYRIETISSG
jgi:hypothetical protein